MGGFVVKMALDRGWFLRLCIVIVVLIYIVFVLILDYVVDVLYSYYMRCIDICEYFGIKRGHGSWLDDCLE